MSWKKILKDETGYITQIETMLGEGILPGYSIRVDVGTIATGIEIVVSKFPGLKNNTFRFYDLHNMGPNIPVYLEPNAWQRFVQPVNAAIVGLDLFLREVERNNDFDKIDDNNYEMVLEGERIRIEFTLGRSCDSKMESISGDIRAELCLSYTVDENTPASGDSWLAIYLVANMLKDADLATVERLADSGTIPDVLYNAMKAVIDEEFNHKCNFCENIIPEGDSSCENCGYYVNEPDTSDVTAHEGQAAFIYVYPSGWDCPYEHSGDEFIEYEEECEEHGIEPASNGPNYGYEASGYYMARIDAYLHNNLLVENPSRGFSSVEPSLAKRTYDESDLLLDFFEYFGIEEAADMLDMVAEELPQGGWKIDTGTHLFRYDMNDIVEYNPDDEETEKMQDLIRVLTEYNMQLDFAGATDEELNAIIEEEIENMESALESLKNSVPTTDESQVDLLEDYISELKRLLD